MTQLATTNEISANILEQVVIGGDLAKLTATERVSYYTRVCESIGVNPLTKPFAYITLNGRLTLYALRDCTDQLRKIHQISVVVMARQCTGDVYTVSTKVSTPDSRTDESDGAVSIAGLKGEALANAYMKAETKAKRRATLSIIGLGWLDELEVDTIPNAPTDTVDVKTGELLSPSPTPSTLRPAKKATFQESTPSTLRPAKKAVLQESTPDKKTANDERKAAIDAVADMITSSGIDPQIIKDHMLEELGNTDTRLLGTERARDLLAWIQEYTTGPGQEAPDLTDSVSTQNGFEVRI